MSDAYFCHGCGKSVDKREVRWGKWPWHWKNFVNAEKCGPVEMIGPKEFPEDAKKQMKLFEEVER